VRIIHTADLHLGTTTYGIEDPSTGLNRRVQDFFVAFDQCVNYAIERNADVVLLCGDTFKDVSPSSTLLKMFANRIYQLTSKEIEVIVLLGNHDTPKTVGRAAPMEVFDELKLSRVHIFNKPDAIDLTSRDGVKLRIFALPYKHPIHVAAKAEKARLAKVELDTNELMAAFQAEIENNIRAFTKIGKGDAQVGILAAHLLVEGARRGAERVYILGAEFAVPSRMLQSDSFDFVALGHVHSYQTLPNKVPMVYSGSLEKVDFSEADEKKGFVDITYEGGMLQWKFVPVKTRRMINMELDCTETKDPTKLIAESIEKIKINDAIVRLILKIRPSIHLDLDLIRERLVPAFWHQVKFERTFEKPNEATAVWRSLNPHETLEQYLKAAKLSEDERRVVGRLGNEIIEEVLSEAGKA